MRPALVISLATSLLGTALSTGDTSAHEFWIDPQAFEVAPGAPVVADLRVGDRFVGPSFPYIPDQTRRFEIVAGGEARPVESRMGDRPAVNEPAGEGLVTLTHVAADHRLTWDAWEEFESFLRHKDAAWVLERHAERGLPREGVGEVYSRYAKALVAVGDGAGSDRPQGLLTEIVALANPYTDDISDGLPVRVLYEGDPRPGAQVELFERAPDGTVAVSTVEADAEGVAVLPVKPGHAYLADAVVLREPSAELAAARNAVWESLWASLTFAVPD